MKKKLLVIINFCVLFLGINPIVLGQTCPDRIIIHEDFNDLQPNTNSYNGIEICFPADGSRIFNDPNKPNYTIGSHDYSSRCWETGNSIGKYYVTPSAYSPWSTQWEGQDPIYPGTGNIVVVDGIDDNQEKLKVWKTTVNVVAGVRYEFSAKVKNVNTNHNYHFLTSQIFLGIENQNFELFVRPSYSTAWSDLGGTWYANTTGAVTLYLAFIGYDDEGYDFAFDEIKFVEKSPLPPTRVFSNQICSGATSKVSSELDGLLKTGESFIWYDQQGQIIPSSISQRRIFSSIFIMESYFQTPVLTATTDYYVAIRNSLGCESVRKKVTITVLPAPNATFAFGEAGITNYKVGATVSVRANDLALTNYSWDWGDETHTTGQTSATHVYNEPGAYKIKLSVTSSNGCLNFSEITINIFMPLCEYELPPSGSSGKFMRNKANGSIVYLDECNREFVIDCLGTSGMPVAELVSTTATVYTDKFVRVSGSVAPNNPFLAGYGNWRPQGTFTYNNAGATNAGLFSAPSFNWQLRTNIIPNKWVPSGQVQLFSPDGEALEERNALGIYSCVKFGYSKTLPYLTAQNAEYKQVMFEGFENIYQGSYLEGDLQLLPGQGNRRSITDDPEAVPHSGSFCFELENAGTREFNLAILPLGETLKKAGVSVKFWAKTNSLQDVIAVANLFKLRLKGLEPVSNKDFNVKMVARTGLWMLLEAELPPADLAAVAGSSIAPVITYSDTDRVWLDDIRMQPINAQVNAYVYDTKTQKLLTSFDDQHFGLYYQYNAEGKLVRKQVETKQGLETIQETQYNTPVE